MVLWLPSDAKFKKWRSPWQRVYDDPDHRKAKWDIQCIWLLGGGGFEWMIMFPWDIPFIVCRFFRVVPGNDLDHRKSNWVIYWLMNYVLFSPLLCAVKGPVVKKTLISKAPQMQKFTKLWSFDMRGIRQKIKKNTRQNCCILYCMFDLKEWNQFHWLLFHSLIICPIMCH